MTSTTTLFETVRHALGQVSVLEDDLLVSACVIHSQLHRGLRRRAVLFHPRRND